MRNKSELLSQELCELQNCNSELQSQIESGQHKTEQEKEKMTHKFEQQLNRVCLV